MVIPHVQEQAGTTSVEPILWIWFGVISETLRQSAAVGKMLGKTRANRESSHSLPWLGELGKVLWEERSGPEGCIHEQDRQAQSKAVLQLLLPHPVPPFLLLLLSMRTHCSKKPNNNCQQLFLEDNFYFFSYSGILPGQVLCSQTVFEKTDLWNASLGILLNVLAAKGKVWWTSLCSSTEFLVTFWCEQLLLRT